MRSIMQRSAGFGKWAGYVFCGIRGQWWCLALAAFGCSVQLWANGGRHSLCVTIGRRVIGRSFNAICPPRGWDSV